MPSMGRCRQVVRGPLALWEKIDPDEPFAAIGSGGSYATAAARALIENTELGARDIAEKSMKIAGDICIYTNDRIMVEELKA